MARRWPNLPGASGASVRGLAEMGTDQGGRWRDLGVRVASAAVLIPVFLACLWWGGLVWTFVSVLAGLLMAREWARMARSWTFVAVLVGGAVGLVPAVAALIWLRERAPYGMMSVMFVFGVVWASDIGAYMVGRLVGGAKLAPSISPGKTRSGAVGGLVSVVVVGLGAAWAGGGPWATTALIAAALGVAAQAGDLLESVVKRHFAVKDSGDLIPGHGGLLDRLDAVLLAAPVAAVLVAWRGVELWR